MSKKILVMIPSGEIYDHDCVRWYDYQNVQANLNLYYNVGDGFVFDSSLKLLNFDHVEALNTRNPTPAEIDYYNAEFDYCFLRGSNYLHDQMDWEQAIPVLEKLKIPIVAFGIGAQAPFSRPLELSAATLRVLKLISEKSVSIGVRGEYTAQVLHQLGIHNVRIIGCPTLFRARNPDLKIKLPPLSTVENVAFTLRREVGKNYTPDVKQYLIGHRDTIEQLAKQFQLALMAQGEIEEKKIVLGNSQQREEAFQTLNSLCWTKDWYLNRTVLDLYRDRLFYSDVVADYENFVRGKDLVLGYRLHGNLMALANGIPSIYFTYDSRTIEFVKTFNIPAYNVFSNQKFELEQYWNQDLFDRFNRTYQERYYGMKEFLEENAIDHRL